MKNPICVDLKLDTNPSDSFGKGREFYTSLGHRPETWSNPVFAAHLIGGIRWSLGLE